MNMIYENDTLYVDLEGDMDIREVSILKERLFSVLDQYDIYNVVLNTKNSIGLNKKKINLIKKEYKGRYNGNFKVI